MELVITEPDRDPWEQQPGECAEHYAFFRMWLERAPKDRRLSRFFRDNEHRYKNRTQFYQIAAKWTWESRAQAYDRHMYVEMQAGHTEQLKKQYKRRLAIVDKMYDIIDFVFDDQFAKMKEGKVRFSVDTGRKLVDSIAKFEKMGMTELEETVEMTHQQDIDDYTQRLCRELEIEPADLGIDEQKAGNG